MTTSVQISSSTKVCAKCKIEKAVDLFSLHKNRKGGRYPYCKECRRISHSKIAAIIAPKERIRRFENYQRIKSDPIKYSKMLKQMRETNKRSIIAHPDRMRARAALINAVRTGVLVRPKFCSECQCECKPHAHHDSYLMENALKVRWLCRKCHMAHHRKYPDPVK